MSRPMIARVVFSVLIALALVVGIYSSVQGAARLTAASTKSGQAHVNLSLHPLQSSSSSSSQLQSFGSQPGTVRESGHNCNSESYNPLDD